MGNHHSKSSNDNGSDDSSSSHVCDQPAFNTTSTTPMVDNFEFHELNMIISGACAAFSTVMIFALMCRHAMSFSKPHEQSNIMRICLFIPTYAVGSFIEVCAPTAYVYLQPWLEVTQAFALASFFILLCRLLSSEIDERRDVFLAPMKLIQKKSGNSVANAVAAYRKTWIAVFQFPIITILLAIFTDITQGANVYCFGSHKTYFASLWLEIIEKISVAVAVIAVLRTYAQLKVELRPHRALQKLFAFKLLIGLQFLQQIVYMILTRINPSPLQPTAMLSYTDMQIGIPLLLVSCELVIFSVFFHFAYSVTPYCSTSRLHKPVSHDDADDGHINADSGSYYGGPLGIRAWISTFNPSEIVAAIMFAFKMRQEASRLEHDSDQSRPLNPYPTSYAQPMPPQPQQYDSYEPYRAHQQQEPPRYSGRDYESPRVGEA
ncbi:putative Transmembrane protein 184C [Seiridium cardinale]